MLISYLLIINAAAFILMLADKRKARKNLWKIPEIVLLGAALLGSDIGVMSGLYLVRCKTRQPKFTVGIPAILAAQILLTVILLCLVKKP